MKFVLEFDVKIKYFKKNRLGKEQKNCQSEKNIDIQKVNRLEAWYYQQKVKLSSGKSVPLTYSNL